MGGTYSGIYFKFSPGRHMDRQSAQKSPILVAQDMLRIRVRCWGRFAKQGILKMDALGSQESLRNAMVLGFRI